MKTFILQASALLILAGIASANGDAWQQRDVVGTPPAARSGHTAVWTGSEMIVWGGGGAGGAYRLNTGGRFNPATNTWTPVTTVGAPTARHSHAAVWTGSEMIVWGGHGNAYLNTGGRYNPASDSWTEVTSTAAPTPRSSHTAIWTGDEMIIWGGATSSSTLANNGARYNPGTNSWMPVTTTGAPAARVWHTAVWTGNEMIVWGGVPSTPWNIPLNTGGRYNPAENRWTALPATAAPSARYGQTAVWTGSEMIVWGGEGGGFGSQGQHVNTGARFNPASNMWAPMSTADAPRGRVQHSEVWTGTEMIVWSGYVGAAGERENTGGRYNPATNSWLPTVIVGAPPPRTGHTAVWTGREMLVWGGFLAGYLNDTFSYTPDCEDFRITSAVFDSGNLTLSFPAVSGRIYTLWSSDTLAAGTWVNTGLPALTGNGAPLTFTVPAPAAGTPRRFFRVRSDP